MSNNHIQIVSLKPLDSNEVARSYPCAVLSHSAEPGLFDDFIVNLAVEAITEKARYYLVNLEAQSHITAVNVLCGECLDYMDISEEGNVHQCPVVRLCSVCEKPFLAHDEGITKCLSCILYLRGIVL